MKWLYGMLTTTGIIHEAEATLIHESDIKAFYSGKLSEITIQSLSDETGYEAVTKTWTNFIQAFEALVEE